MGQQYRLQALANEDLLAALSSIARRGNEITAELLAHLSELDERQLFLELGFPSLFAYCVEALGLCEATAGRRVAAVRVCRMYPEAFARVASGELHVSALCSLKQYLNPENAAELFELCCRRSSRQIEDLLAARFPRPDVRERIQRLPVQATLNAESQAQATPQASRIQPLSLDRYGVHFTADGEFRDLLERVRGLASHRLPNGDVMTLLKRGLEAYERELEKERFGVGRKPRAFRFRSPNPNPLPLPLANPNPFPLANPNPFPLANPNPTSMSRRRRKVSAAVARAVYLRDHRQCTFVAEGGRRCCARRFLELDHIQPWAVGGADTIENLRLRCRAHNRHFARLYFGTAHVCGRVAASRSRAP